MTDRLVLDGAVREAILERAREGAPDEVCGVLVGERGDTDRVTDQRPVPNVADRPRTRYELDPERTVEVVEAVEAAGDDVVGFYHTHPRGPSRPSETDRRRATWTGYVYAIALPERDELRAWRWTGEQFAPLDVEVDGTASAA